MTSYFFTTANRMKKKSDDAPEIIRTCIFENPDDSSPPCAEAICVKEEKKTPGQTPRCAWLPQNDSS